MDDFTKTLSIQAPAGETYQAVASIAGLKGWWTDNTTGEDGTITFRFGSGNYQTMRILEAVPNTRVVWKCIAQYFPFEGAPRNDEWVGTTMSFDIVGNSDETSTLTFTHVGLAQLECFDLCNNGWGYYLASLKRYVEEGEGTPYSEAA